MEVKFSMFLNFFDVISIFSRCFFSMFSLFMFCHFRVFAFLCFVLLCFVIDPFYVMGKALSGKLYWILPVTIAEARNR